MRWTSSQEINLIKGGKSQALTSINNHLPYATWLASTSPYQFFTCDNEITNFGDRRKLVHSRIIYFLITNERDEMNYFKKRTLKIFLLSSLALLSADIEARGPAPTSADRAVVIQGTGINPNLYKKELPDFSVTAPVNANKSGDMSIWRVGVCPQPHRFLIKVKNQGKSYDVGSGQKIFVSLKIKSRVEKNVYIEVTDHISRLNKGESKVIKFTIGSAFDQEGNYSLGAYIHAEGVAESNYQNNRSSVQIFVNQQCP